MEEQDRMKYLELSKDLIEKSLRRILLQKREIEFAYLFGSFSKNVYFHDIDIALFLKKGFNFRDTSQFPFGYESSISGELSSELKTDRIDIVILNKADVHLIKNIINTGKLLFERNLLSRIEFENSIRKEFIDTEHFRKIKTYYLQKKIEQKCTT